VRPTAPVDLDADEQAAERADLTETHGDTHLAHYRPLGLEPPAIVRPPAAWATPVRTYTCATHGDYTAATTDPSCELCRIDRMDARISHEYTHRPAHPTA